MKGLLAHKLRLALTGLAIVLGVTFVSGTLVLTDTLHSTFTSLFGSIYQHVDFEVRGTAALASNSSGNATRNPIPESVATTVRRVPGVAVAEGIVGGYAQFAAPDGRAVTTGGAPTIGTSFGSNSELSPLRVVQGSPPTTAHEVAMDEGTAQKYHFRVGEHVRVLLEGPTQTFTISAIVSFGTADNLAGATLAAFDLPTAQTVLDVPGKYDAVDVLADPGVNKTALRRSIAAVLPPGTEVVTGQTVADESVNQINQALGFFSTALLIFAFIALFVGAFTIFNTFSIIVGQRTRELALLRVVGASRRQIFRSVLAEAAVVGLVASLIGLGLGVLSALGIEALLKAFGISLPANGLVFLPHTAVAAIVIGVGVTVVSAISPARRAVRIPPVAALADYQGTQVESSGRRIVAGSVVAVLGVIVLVIGLHKPAIQLVGIGAVAGFIGIGMLAPLVARPLASVIGRPLQALGMAGRLGRENSMRSPRRTAQTSSALMVGLALVATIAVFGASLSRSTTSSVDQAISADYIILPSSNSAVGFSNAVSAAAAKVPGVVRTSTFYAGQFELRGQLESLAAVSANHLSQTVMLRIVSGAGAPALAAGELLVDSNVARSDHLSVGTVVPVKFAQTGNSTMRVGGIYKPNALLGSYVVSDGFYYAHYSSNHLPVAVLLTTVGGTSAAASRAIHKGLADFPGLKVQTRAEFEKSQQQQLNQLLGLVYALLALAVLIALIGIVNTLMLSVFERTHEIGLLRAVGMRRRQVRAMIRAESVILSLFGAVIGIVIGTALGISFAEALKQQGITDIVVPVRSLVVFLVIAALLGVAAATWPARKAAKLDVLAAIATE
jgi:putative ABC transport system permease protein